MNEVCYCGSKSFKTVEGLTQVDNSGKEHPIIVCLKCGTEFILVEDKDEASN